MKVCALTNVYNEKFNLPNWLGYYGTQVGSENCIVVDNGSDDGSTDQLSKVGKINMPRSKFSDHVRARFVSSLVGALLDIYDAVIYSDCDEFLVADPLKYEGLVDFCSHMSEPVATAIGLNIFHNVAEEGPLRPEEPLLKQRRFVQFASPMCKSLIVRKAVTWGGGFHSCSLPPHFSGLYLFHSRWADLGESLKRLKITRDIEFVDDKMGRHQKASYLHYINIFKTAAERQISSNFSFDTYIEDFRSSVCRNQSGLYAAEKSFRSTELHEIPAEFRGLF